MRSRVLESMERKRKLRTGALEVQTSIFQDVIILDRKISEMESELPEAEDELRLVEMERCKTQAEGLRVMDAAGGDVGWQAASGAQSSEAEV